MRPLSGFAVAAALAVAQFLVVVHQAVATAPVTDFGRWQVGGTITAGREPEGMDYSQPTLRAANREPVVP